LNDIQGLEYLRKCRHVFDMKILDKIPLTTLILVSLTLGLAPFTPVPHIWEKLTMLVGGQLTQPIDIFDLVLHGAPWALLGAKLVRMSTVRPPQA